MNDRRIAVIGMAVRMPGADDVAGFWARALAGESCPGAPIAGEDAFDAEFFGLGPRRAARTDPQHRVFAEVAHHALEDAGYAAGAGVRVGVFAGAGHRARALRGGPAENLAEAAAAALSDPAAARELADDNEAQRLALRAGELLRLTGPAVGVHSGPSTGLVAVHLAVRALLDGDADLALAGAAALPGAARDEPGTSPTGVCRAFDADADGSVPGGGVAAVVLKRLDRALADGDRIHAVLLGTGVSGPGVGAVRAALGAAELTAADLGYVEAHGIGDPDADRVEYAALAEAYAGADCALGCAAPAIGDLDTAAGLAGLVRAVCAVRDGRVPPLAAHSAPDPVLAVEDGPFHLPAEAEEWPDTPGPRVAGVNASGPTAAHAIVAQPPNVRPGSAGAGRRAYVPGLLPLSAGDPEALRDLAGAYSALLRSPRPPRPADVLTTAALGRRRARHRLVAYGDGPGELAAALDAFVAGERGERHSAYRASDAVRPVFAYTGPAEPSPEAAGALYERFEVFAAIVDEASSRFERLAGVPLVPLVTGRERPTPAALLPMQFTVQAAMTALWRHLGVTPRLVTGHGAGELAALYAAGALSLVDGVRLAAGFAALIEQESGPGAMLAFHADHAAVDTVLAACPGLDLAAVNGPEHHVLAGTSGTVDKAARLAKALDMRVQVLPQARAYHSALLDGVAAPLRALAASVSWRPAEVPFLSALDGEVRAAGWEPDAEYIVAQARRTVRFDAVLDHVAALDDAVLLELGPQPVLSRFARAAAPGLPAVPSGRSGAEVDPFIRAVGELHCAGADVNWSALTAGTDGRRIDLPLYPFRRVRRPSGAATAPPAASAAPTREDAMPPTPAPTDDVPPEVPGPGAAGGITGTERRRAAQPPMGGRGGRHALTEAIHLAAEAAASAARAAEKLANHDEDAAVATPSTAAPSRPDFGVCLLGGRDAAPVGYRLLRRAAMFADEHGLATLWLPRARPAATAAFPSPSVLAAALAADTEHVRLHASDVALPAYDTLRLAEEWSMVDNLSGGRAALTVGPGEEPEEFVYFPDRYGDREDLFAGQLGDLHGLWRGERLTRRIGDGREVPVGLHPAPVQAVPPLHVAVAAEPDAYDAAGRAGLGVVADLLCQDTARLAANVAVYRAAREEAGLAAGGGRVTVMLHAHLAEDLGSARRAAFAPMTERMRARPDVFAVLLDGLGMPADARGEEPDLLFQRVYDRFCGERALIGSVESAAGVVAAVRDAGADEIAAQVDVAVDTAALKRELGMLANLRDRFTGDAGPATGHAVHTAAEDRPRWFGPAGGPRDADAAAAPGDAETVPAAKARPEPDAAEPGPRPSAETAARSAAETDPAPLPVPSPEPEPGRTPDTAAADDRGHTATADGDEAGHVPSPDENGEPAPAPVPPPRAEPAAEAPVAAPVRGRGGPLPSRPVRPAVPEQHRDDTVPDADRVRDTVAAAPAGPTPLASPFAPATAAAPPTAPAPTAAPAAPPAPDDAAPGPAPAPATETPPHRDPSPDHLPYWRTVLAPPLPVLDLPTDRPRPAVPSGRTGTESAALDPKIAARLRRLSGGPQVLRTAPTPPLLAGLATALRRFTGQDAVVIGVPGAHGPLPLRVDLSGDPAFTDLLTRIGETLHGLHEHGAGFDVIRSAAATAGPAGHHPLFQVAAQLDAAPGAEPLDLLWRFSDSDQGIVCHVEYAADLFDAATARRLAHYVRDVLTAAVDEPGQRLSQLDDLSDDDMGALDQWHRGAQAELPGQAVGDLVAALAARSPEAPAAVHGGEMLTYGTLNALANQLAHQLRERGTGPSDVVAVLMPRDLRLIVTILAVVKSGAAYLPLDPSAGPERIAAAVASARVKLTVVEHGLAAMLPEGADRLGPDPAELDRFPVTPPEPAAAPDGACHVLPPAGGEHAGVVIGHRGLVNLCGWFRRRFRLSPEDRVAVLARPDGDAAVLEIWPALTSGAVVVLAGEDPPGTPEEVAAWLDRTAATVAVRPTAAAESLSALPAERRPGRLRTLIAIGEPLRRRPAEEPPYELVYAYGPTEATVIVTSQPVGAEGPHRIPIGSPVDNTLLYVLDGAGRPLPVGVPGELYVAGEALAAGYLHAERLTAMRFPVDGAGQRYYRTGDLVRWTNDGVLEYRGRVGERTAVEGVRVDPGEVAAMLRELPEVADAAVLAVPEPDGGAHLAAYVVPAETGAEDAPGALAEALGARVPAYQVPRTWTTLPALPYDARGALDRAALTERTAPDPAPAPAPPTAAPSPGVPVADAPVSGVPAAPAPEAPAPAEPDALVPAATPDPAPSADRAADEPEAAEGPLSAVQDRMAGFSDRLGAALNVAVEVEFRGALDPAVLREALGALTLRHHALRSAFAEEDGHWRQRVLPGAEARLKLVDLTALPEAQRAERAVSRREEARAEPFDLAEGRVWRGMLVRLAEERWRLVVIFHHLITDDSARRLFLTELAELYTAAVEGGSPRLPDVTQAIAYAAARPGRDDVEERMAYWLRRLDGVEVTAELPYDDPSAPAGPERAYAETVLPPSVAASAMELARRRRTGPYAVYAAALGVFLSRLTGRERVVLRAQYPDRDDPATATVMANLSTATLLDMDVRPSGGLDFAGLATRVEDARREGLARHVPFHMLMDELREQRGPRVPFDLPQFLFPGAYTTGLRLPEGLTAHFDNPPVTGEMPGTMFVCVPGTDTWKLGLVHPPGRLARETAEGWLDTYATVLAQLCEEPGTPIADL